MTTRSAKLHSLWHALTSVCQRISAEIASVYARAQAWIAEQQLIERLIKTRLLWLQLIVIVFTFVAGEFKSAEPDTWSGRFFASRFEAVKVGYRTLLQKQPLTQQALGFQQILALALTSARYVTDYIAKEHIGPIDTIIYDGQSGLGLFQGYSTLEHPFRTPLTIRLKDGNSRNVTASLGYTENQLKDRFLTPVRWWGMLAFRASIMINVVLLILRYRESNQPTREGRP